MQKNNNKKLTCLNGYTDADNMVAIFENLDDKFIEFENNGITIVNIHSSISIPNNCNICNDWTSPQKTKMYKNCNELFYDPADSCALGSDDINCFDNKVCGDPYYEYICDSNDLSSGYSCAQGDLLLLFLFSNHDALLILLNQLADNFVAWEE